MAASVISRPSGDERLVGGELRDGQVRGARRADVDDNQGGLFGERGEAVLAAIRASRFAALRWMPEQLRPGVVAGR